MKRSNTVLIAGGALFALSIVNLLRSRGHEVSAAGTNAEAARATLIAAPGRVEAVSEEVRVISELSGRLKRVAVEEGHSAQRREVLAGIENDEYRTRAGAAQVE